MSLSVCLCTDLVRSCPSVYGKQIDKLAICFYKNGVDDTFDQQCRQVINVVARVQLFVD